MKIAISSKGSAPESEVDPRFGRASYLLVFDTESGAWNAVDNAEAQGLAHAAGIRAAETVCRAGARIVISGDVGPTALAVLVAGDVHFYRCGATIARGAMEAFRRGELAEL
ncbi:MAG: NifB/NifX family molybdenum-iron cluster-binding protein [Acidobacteriota bacterium]|nr:NifB/NifX family molybdenum-iron cluster-binding protein [Acidobacteriota bacterium]